MQVYLWKTLLNGLTESPNPTRNNLGSADILARILNGKGFELTLFFRLLVSFLRLSLSLFFSLSFSCFCYFLGFASDPAILSFTGHRNT